MGKVATSPLPPGGPGRFRAGGQNPKWPTSGQGGYITPAASGGPHRFRAGGQNQKWPTSWHGGYITPAAWGVPTASERGDTIRIGPQVGKVATSPLPPRGVPTASERWDRIRIGPQVGKMATLPLPLGGPHRFRAGGQNQNWPTSGQGGYITPAVWGVPTASDRGDRIRSGPQVGKVATSPLAASGVPTASERGERIRIGPKVGKMATLPLPLGGPHRFRAGRQNQNWPTSRQDGYITPAVWGSPPLQSGGTESEVAHKWARWLHHPCRLGVPTASERGDRIRSGPQVGKVATSPLPPRGVPTASERGDRIRSGPQVGKVATSPLPPGGSPPLQSGGTESELAHKWARWLHHPCRLRGPHRFSAGGQNQKWPTSGQGGYITPAASGVPSASERGDRIRIGPQVGKVATSPVPPGGSPPLQSGGTESEVAHKWARWLHHPCRLGGPHRFRAGGQNQKWPTSGQGGYITRAAWGVPTASERGDRIRSGPPVGKVATSPLPPRRSPPLQSGHTESEVAHKWAWWLHHPCRLRGPQRFRAGDRIRIGPQVGKAATSPLPPEGSPPLQSGGTGSELAHKWARRLHHPCRLGGPHRFRAGGQNPKWPTSGQGGYITPAAWGVPTASERGDRIRSGPQVGKVATSPPLSEGSPPF